MHTVASQWYKSSNVGINGVLFSICQMSLERQLWLRLASVLLPSFKDSFWINGLVHPVLPAAPAYLQLNYSSLSTARELFFSCFFARSVTLCIPAKIIFPSLHLLLVFLLSTCYGATTWSITGRDLLCSFWRLRTFSTDFTLYIPSLFNISSEVRSNTPIRIIES